MSPYTYYNLNPVNFLIISGIVHIYLLAGVLFFRKEINRTGNRYLALVLVTIGFYVVYLMLLDTNLDNHYPSLLHIPYSFLTVIGPLLYLYTRSYTHPNHGFGGNLWTHFVPLGVEVSLQLFQIVLAIKKDVIYYNVPYATVNGILIYVMSSVSIYYYVNKSSKLIAEHEAEIGQHFSDLGRKTLHWLKKLLSYYRVLWLVWVAFAIVFLLLFRAQIQNLFTVGLAYALLVTLTYLVYWIGLQGLIKGSYMNFQSSSNREKKRSYITLSDRVGKELAALIQQAMEAEKYYLRPTLSLREFASALDKDPNLVSFILNTHLEKSFYEFVNTYRIEAIKTRLAQNDAVQFTLLAIALDCGFNSKTSFNRVFKEMTGFTPTQYLKKQSIK